MSYKIYSDGCHIPEFNTAGVGGYIEYDGVILVEFSIEVKEKEYMAIHERYAVKKALEVAIDMGIENEKISFYSDDLGLMRILSKEGNQIKTYIEEDNLMESLSELRNKFSSIEFNHIPREENKHADKLSRRYVESKIFAKSQMIRGAFKHKNLISKNNFTQENQKEFRKIRKDIDKFLVSHFYWNKKEKMRQMDLFEASIDKESSEVNYKLISENRFLTEKSWEKTCIKILDEGLKKMRESTNEVGLVLADEFLILDKVMRGRKQPLRGSMEAIKDLSNTLDSFKKVVVHREDCVVNKIMDDKKREKMKPNMV